MELQTPAVDALYKVGIVEDEEIMQKVLTAMLKTDRYEVVVYPDGRSALDKLPNDNLDFVILDVNLPDMSGHDVCRALKGDPRTRRIPVLMLTGEARDLELRVAGLDAGADDYMFKPVGPKVLLPRIRALLKTVRAR
jgi:DNA-binding response OmpR family regulator